MGQRWRSTPDFKVEVDSTEITRDSISVVNVRPENAVSYLMLTANNYQGKIFITNLDAFDTVKLSLRYGTDSWTQTFEGAVEEVAPELTSEGQKLRALVYGYGRAIRNTHCDANYGEQSDNTSLDTPKEIWDDLVDNMINKSFGGAATGYAITKTYIASINNPTIGFIRGAYRNCLELINEICGIYTAYRAGSASVHWFVDPSKNLFINTIGSHEDAAQWPNYWNGSEAASTLEEGKDFAQFHIRKTVQEYANKIVLFAACRKPSWDHWTENNSGNWGSNAYIDLSDENGAGNYVVGSYSLKASGNDGANPGNLYYPSTQDAAWNLEAMGSEQTIPTLNFYFKGTNANWAKAIDIRLCTDATNYFEVPNLDDYYVTDNEWQHYKFPVGPYYDLSDEMRKFRWAETNSPDWADIDYIYFGFPATLTFDAYFDDLHFAGKVVREAYNSTAISSNDEKQHILHYETAVDDSLKASDDSGTAARLAYAELLRRQTTPINGQVQTPGIVDILPGQKVHIHAAKKTDGSFEIDENFRVTKIGHIFSVNGFRTTLDLTNDLANTITMEYAKLLSSLYKATLVDPEAKNLKATGIDPLMARLSKDYP